MTAIQEVHCQAGCLLSKPLAPERLTAPPPGTGAVEASVGRGRPSPRKGEAISALQRRDYAIAALLHKECSAKQVARRQSHWRQRHCQCLYQELSTERPPRPLDIPLPRGERPPPRRCAGSLPPGRSHGEGCSPSRPMTTALPPGTSANDAAGTSLRHRERPSQRRRAGNTPSPRRCVRPLVLERPPAPPPGTGADDAFVSS